MSILSLIVWFVLTVVVYVTYVRHEAVDSIERFFSGIVLAIFLLFVVGAISRIIGKIKFRLANKK